MIAARAGLVRTTAAGAELQAEVVAIRVAVQLGRLPAVVMNAVPPVAVDLIAGHAVNAGHAPKVRQHRPLRVAVVPNAHLVNHAIRTRRLSLVAVNAALVADHALIAQRQALPLLPLADVANKVVAVLETEHIQMVVRPRAM